MDQHLDKNMTMGSSHSGVTHWKSIPQMSPAVENIIIVLGVLTFVLQLCLALFFMLKCWSLNSKIRQDKKPCDVSKHEVRQVPTAPPLSSFTPVRIDEDSSDYLCPPSIPWDLVQSA